MMAAVTTCRSCGAPIFWVETEKGKAMPVDAEPVSDGNVEMTGEMVGNRPLVRVHANGQSQLLDTGDRYLSHFTTCPDSAEWRRDGR